MKSFSAYFIVVILIQLMVLSSCKEKENEGPVVEITSPVDGILVMPGDRITVTANAEDPDGSIFDMSLSFDAKKVAFDFRQDPGSGFRIWEVNTDGTGLRQLTDGPYDDIEPCYLPDGRIVFVPHRETVDVLDGLCESIYKFLKIFLVKKDLVLFEIKSSIPVEPFFTLRQGQIIIIPPGSFDVKEISPFSSSN